MFTRTIARQVAITSIKKTPRSLPSLAHNFQARHAGSTSASSLSPSTKSAPINSSFVTSIFQGAPDTNYLFPYPNVLGTEEKEELSMVVDSVNKYFEEVNDATQNDELSKVPEEKVQQMKELGLFGLQVPQELGGLGATNTMYARLVEIVGKHDLGVGIFLGAHQSIGFKGILLAGNPEQKQKYLPKLASGETIAAFALTEPASGSDASSIKTNAVLSADGKHYVLNGSKIWISNGGISEIFTVFAQTDVKDEKTGQMTKKISAFIVERSFGGVTNGPPLKKMGIKCSNTVEVYFDNTKVPVENMLGQPGDGFKIAMNILNNGRFGMAAALSGTMKELIAHAAKHARDRTQFGAKIMEYDAIKEKITQMNLKAYATESTAYLLSGIMDSGAKEYQLEAAISKVFASDSAWFVADEAIQILGGMGYMKDLPLERVMRDLRIFRIFEGTNDILRLFVAGMGVRATGKTLLANKTLALRTTSPLDMFFSTKTIPSPHPELEKATSNLNEAITSFFLAVSKVVIKYKKDLANHQIILRRIGDAAISIYTMAATVSRAADAVTKGRSSAEYEKLLTTQYCAQTLERVKQLADELRNADDSNTKKIANAVFANGGYVPLHPLDL